jgi:dihydroneopterin aldolase
MSNSDTMRIHLQDVHFFGNHGMYEEEKILGNTFIVDLHVDFTPTHSIVHHIEDTIDYVTIYELVKARMAKATPLLETVVTELAQQILDQFPIVTTVFIKITKKQVAIPHLQGNMAVSILKNR